MRIARVVAAILCDVERHHSKPDRLQQLGNEKNRDNDLADRHAAVCDSSKNRCGFVEALGKLHRGFLTTGCKRSNVKGVVVQKRSRDVAPFDVMKPWRQIADPARFCRLEYTP